SYMGTPDYIAPEQARDAHRADIRADLYSLGCTFYYLLSGRVPFPGGTLTEKLLKHQMDEAPPLSQLRPEVPPGVEEVVKVLLAKRAEERFQTPKQLAIILSDVLAAGGNVPSSMSSIRLRGKARPDGSGAGATAVPTAVPVAVAVADPFAELGRADTADG